MQKVNIRFHINSYNQFKENLQKILTVFSGNDIFHLEINLIMDTLTDNEIENVVNLIKTHPTFKEISNETIYTFIATLLPTYKTPKTLTKIKGLLTRIDLVYVDNMHEINGVVKSLQKKKLPVSILIKDTDFDTVISIYKRCSIWGVPIFSYVNTDYDDKFTSLFWKWVNDKKGCRFNIFADILSSIMIDYWGTKCQYKSCLTKYFVIDAESNIYACCKEPNNLICKLQEISSTNEIFSHTNFISILECAIQKRANCKSLCEFYDLCQGGCLLTNLPTVDDCKNRPLFALMENINEQFKQIINNADYRDLNPAVKEMILSGVASNKLFEKGMIV